MPQAPLLSIEDLCIQFPGADKPAVDHVAWDLKENETIAIVGESGSGKSVCALSLMDLIPPSANAEVSGKIIYQGKNLRTLPRKELRKMRGSEIAYIFQEPGTSLNPCFSVGYQIAEAIKIHHIEKKNIKQAAIEALERVGIQDPKNRYHAYPHELSGGMQQRVMIAMALACRPKILVADEPTTALDASTQKQIIDLLKTLRTKNKMSIVMITHNFGILENFSDRIVVMFRGKVVESGPTAQILNNPQHPYTQALINCIPTLGMKRKRLESIDYAAIEAAL